MQRKISLQIWQTLVSFGGFSCVRRLGVILLLFGFVVPYSAFGQPFNDDFNTVGSGIFVFPIAVSGNNINATTQPLEQDLGITGATVWWYFNAPYDGSATINTFGSDFDTVLHVYTDSLMVSAISRWLPRMTISAANKAK